MVAYSGVTKRAVSVTMQSDLKNTSTSLSLYYATNEVYPVDLDDVISKKLLTKSGDNAFQYSSDGNSYCLSVTSVKDNSMAFNLDSKNGSVVEGVCSGHYLPSGTVSVSADVLIVGGGGGGGFDVAGGGGGGGVVQTKYTFEAGSYSVIVGAGGLQGTASAGGYSSIGPLIAIGGANGGGSSFSVGSSATGGGGSFSTAGGAAIYGSQGKSGGSGYRTGSFYNGGGGGGFSEIGENATAAKGGDGGEGYTSDISGTNEVYGSGGGGGWLDNSGATGSTSNRGIGGTNAGSGGVSKGMTVVVSSSAPIANRGGGGGGGGWSSGSNGPGTNGASGIVIVRYKTGSMTATGGTITTVGYYTVHTFNASGTLTVQ